MQDQEYMDQNEKSVFMNVKKFQRFIFDETFLKLKSLTPHKNQDLDYL